MKSQPCSRKGSVTPAEVGENHDVTLYLTRCPLFRPGSLDSRKHGFCRILLGSMLESSRIAEAQPQITGFPGRCEKVYQGMHECQETSQSEPLRKSVQEIVGRPGISFESSRLFPAFQSMCR